MGTYHIYQEYSKQALMGWLLIIGAVVFFFFFPQQVGGHTSKSLFVFLCGIALILWTFRLVHPLVPGLFLLIGVMGFSLSSPSVVLQGFSNPLFFLGLAVFIMGGYFIEGRIYARFMEWSLRFLPLTPFWMFFGIYLTGVFLNLTLPSLQSRIQVGQGLCYQWASYMGVDPSSRMFNYFLISFYQAIFIFSPIFLTGSFYNLIMVSFLHPHDQIRFGWLAWFSYSFVSLILLSLGILIFLMVVNYKNKLTMDREKSLHHMALLGGISAPEKTSLMAALLLIGGFSASFLHQVSTPVWAGLVLLLLLIIRSSSFEIIQKKLEWTDLLLLGALGGMGRIADSLHPITLLNDFSFRDQLVSFPQEGWVIGLALLISLSRLILPYRTVVLLGSFCLIPFFYTTTIHPWVVGFVLLTAASSSWRVHEGLGIGRFLESFHLSTPLNQRQMHLWLAYFNGVRILSVVAALGYWRDQGLL